MEGVTTKVFFNAWDEKFENHYFLTIETRPDGEVTLWSNTSGHTYESYDKAFLHILTVFHHVHQVGKQTQIYHKDEVILKK